MIIQKQNGEKTRTTAIAWSEFTAAERLQRAGKRAGLVFLAAIAAVLVPVFHFVLVPLLVALAPVVGFFTYRETYRLSEKTCPCPDCNTPGQVTQGFNEFPVKFYCYKCRQQLFIDRE